MRIIVVRLNTTAQLAAFFDALVIIYMKIFSSASLVGALLLLALAPSRAQAPAEPTETHCLMLPLLPAGRAQQAALIVEGEVLGANSFWDGRHRRIYTAHRVRVFKRFKGPAAAEITVLTEGGSVDLERQESTNTLRLATGQQGVLFLYPAPFADVAGAGPAWAAFGSEQGFIRYDLTDLTATEPFRQYASIDEDVYAAVTAVTGQPVTELQPNAELGAARVRLAQPPAANRGQAPVINTLSPRSLSAGTGAVLTITGTGFGAARGAGAVEFRNADDNGQTFVKPQDADYLSWADTQIRVRVPSNGIGGRPAGSGTIRVTTTEQLQATSAVGLNVVYALSNVQEDQALVVSRPRHINQNAGGGYTFRFDPGFAANAAANAAWQRALATWRCQTGINWEVGATRTTTGAANDNENSVGFDLANELPANVLGRTTSYYQGCRDASGSAVFWVKEIDTQFSNSITWQFGPTLALRPQYDFESVAVHELGHAQQLAHIILPTAVMHYAIAAGTNSRAVSAGSDVAGGRLVLRGRSFVAPACGPAPMLPAPLATFTAQGSPVGAELSWTTKQECFLQEFVLERAVDTTAWQLVTTLPAGATTTYRYLDAQQLPGVSYYRLRLRRPDGTLDTAAPQAVTDDASLAAGIQFYPNPLTEGPLQLLYAGTGAGQLSLFFYDAIGRYRGGYSLAYQAGLNQLSVSVDNLRAGLYVVRWRDEAGRTGTTRLVKL